MEKYKVYLRKMDRQHLIECASKAFIYSNGYKWFYIESSNIYDLMSAYNKLVSIANNAEYKIYRNFLYIQYLKIQKQYYSCNSKIYYSYDTYSPYSPDYSPDYLPDYSPDSPDYSPD